MLDLESIEDRVSLLTSTYAYTHSEFINEVTLNDYQDMVENFAIYPDAGSGSPLAVMYTGFGLNGEAGEVADHIKKAIRDDGYAKDDNNLTDERFELVVKEIGDVLWYAANLARELDITLGQVAMINIDKLHHRKMGAVIRGSGDER